MPRVVANIDVGATILQEARAVGMGDDLTLVKAPSSSGFDVSTYGNPKPASPIPIPCYGLVSTDFSRFEGTVVQGATIRFTIYRASIMPPTNMPSAEISIGVNDTIEYNNQSYTVLSAGLDEFEAVWNVQASG